MKEFAKEKLRLLEEKYNNILIERGQEAMNDGDGWHDGFFVSATNSAEVVYRQIEFLKRIMPLLDEIVVPSHCDYVGEGHMVHITLEDSFGLEDLKVVLVPSNTRDIIQESMKDQSIRVIATNTPLGRALIGKHRGDILTYHSGEEDHKISISSDPDSISIYEGFKILQES